MELTNIHVSYRNKVPATHGDIWPITWADDDHVYAAASDTLGCPEGLFPRGRNVSIVRVDGEPRSPSIHVLNPMEQLGEALSYEGEGEDKGCWKASCLVCVEGRLYLAAFHHRYAFEMHRESESFLMLTSSYPDLTADLRRFEDSISACHTRSEFTIFQSRALWGPWKMVYQGPGTGTVDYLPRMPCKWLGGRKGQAYIVSAGNFERRPRLEDHYGFVVGKLEWDAAT